MGIYSIRLLDGNMRLLSRFPCRKCTSYCKIQSKVLFGEVLKLLPKTRFHRRTARAKALCFECGQKPLRSCGANGCSLIPLAEHKLHIWVKLGVSIYAQLGNQPLWEEHFEIPPCAVKYLCAGMQESSRSRSKTHGILF